MASNTKLTLTSRSFCCSTFCFMYNLVTPVWGDFMFSVRFRRVRRGNNFCLSGQNRLSLTLDIWHQEYMGLGKCTGWPYHDLDPRSRLWHRLAKICLSARFSENNASLPSMADLLPKSWLLPDYMLEKFCWKLLFWHFFFKFGCVFSRSNTILAISQEWLDWLMWNKKEVHRFDTGYNMWPWPHSWHWPWMFQGQILK